MMTRTFACSVALVLGSSAPARAADYTVDAAHPAADDANPGTPEAPWRTIGRAADVAVAGDTVRVLPGNYPERVELTTPGTAEARITFRAEPSRSVVLHGFKLDGADFVTVRGFRVTHSEAFEGWDETQGVFLGADDVEVLDCSFESLPSAAVVGYWHEPFPQRARIADNTIYRCQMGITITGADWVVERNEIERLYQYGGGDCDYMRFFGDRHVIRENRMHGTDFDEIGAAHVDCFQTFDNNGETGHDILVERNTCMDFHQGFMGEASFHHDISRITFRNNVFAHGHAWGLCIGDIAEIFAYNNTFAHIAYHGIGARGAGSTGHLVFNNIFHDTGTSYWYDDGATLTGDFNLVSASNAPGEPGAHDLLDSDPLFLDDANDDFHLREGSPAIDAAETRTDFADDRDGTTRPAGAGWDVGAYEHTATAPLRIATLGLPPGAAHAPYSAQLRATGGVPPLRWSLAAGTLPAGLSLAADTGWLAGRPTEDGLFHVTTRVTDEASAADEREFDLAIEPGTEPGCDCAVPGRHRAPLAGSALLALVVGLAAAARRARRRRR
ncbi:MAG: right-handed parallel beta-helix repeat-containing protein [Deltaproteobacteria bacterium]|nr:right-handed parallel beta-helix repeat-containing protein [Deltaproteobacteria bacterium]